jgi:hypothetical protein
MNQNGKGDKSRPSLITNLTYDKNWKKTFSKKKSTKQTRSRKKMSRMQLPSKGGHNIAVGICNDLWFIQVFDLEENQKDDQSEKLLVDLTTSNRWKIIEVIKKYADPDKAITRGAMNEISLDLDPTLRKYPSGKTDPENKVKEYND